MQGEKKKQKGCQDKPGGAADYHAGLQWFDWPLGRRSQGGLLNRYFIL
jgi:hypothetical protein